MLFAFCFRMDIILFWSWYYGRKATMRNDGRLSDIAPTILYLKGMEIPAEMTGKSIVQLED